MKYVIGLTGPTGAGKSTVSAAAKKLGFKVIDCDKSARIAAKKGSKGLNALVNAFGKEILNSELELNRAVLAKAAFVSKEKTELLNKTFLPYVIEVVNKQAQGSENILLDAPTLFESGLEKACNITIAVLADSQVRLMRIMNRDCLDEATAKMRMNAGKPDEFYLKNADYVLYNNGDILSCEEELKKIISQL